MKKYLVTYIAEDQFLCELIEANDILSALQKFVHGPLGYDSIYSITTT
jgi:hypothetical protein